MSVEPQPAVTTATDVTSAEVVHAALRFLRVLQYRKIYFLSSLAVAGLLGEAVQRIHEERSLSSLFV